MICLRLKDYPQNLKVLPSKLPFSANWATLWLSIISYPKRAREEPIFSKKHTHYQLRGMASTLRMRTAISSRHGSHGQLFRPHSDSSAWHSPVLVKPIRASRKQYPLVLYTLKAVNHVVGTNHIAFNLYIHQDSWVSCLGYEFVFRRWLSDV